MTYSNFVRNKIIEVIDLYGGCRKAAEHIGIDAAIISKIKSGKYIPKIKTFQKWFPEVRAYEFDDEIVVNKIEQKIEIYCDELEELKATLDRLGYRIIIEKK